MPSALTLNPIRRFAGEINLPGSKSVSNRALLLAAQARGVTRLHNLLDSDDVRYMLDALKALGVRYQLSDCRTRCEVQGVDGALPVAGVLSLFLGNAGTAMRPLAAALSLGRREVILTGEPRMKERPIAHLVTALRQGGAQIDYLEAEGYPPLRLRGGFVGGQIAVDGSVSFTRQFAMLRRVVGPSANSAVVAMVIAASGMVFMSMSIPCKRSRLQAM